MWSVLIGGYQYSLTGLDVEKCTIIEMACIITDKNLNIIEEVHTVHVGRIIVNTLIIPMTN